RKWPSPNRDPGCDLPSLLRGESLSRPTLAELRPAATDGPPPPPVGGCRDPDTDETSPSGDLTTRSTMPQHRPAACAFSIRRGFLSLEILLSLPVVALLLVGLFEFSCLSCGYGSVARASQAGARIAARPG